MILSSFMAFRTDCVIMTPVFVPPAWMPVLNLRLQVRVPGISARVSNRRLTLNTLTTELQLFLSNVLLPESFSPVNKSSVLHITQAKTVPTLLCLRKRACASICVYGVCICTFMCVCICVCTLCV